jgi:hypothetical protein
LHTKAFDQNRLVGAYGRASPVHDADVSQRDGRPADADKCRCAGLWNLKHRGKQHPEGAHGGSGDAITVGLGGFLLRWIRASLLLDPVGAGTVRGLLVRTA